MHPRGEENGARSRTWRFTGRIAGFGTEEGTRVVCGMWTASPFGRFVDVMLEDAGGRRTLIAPTSRVARFVAATYTFDQIVEAPTGWTDDGERIAVVAGDLVFRLHTAGPSATGRLLSLIPTALATHPGWLTLIDPFARILSPGTRTAGSAGTGRREYYGATRAVKISKACARYGDRGLGALAPLSPPVTFGFGSAPALPQVVDVVTTIRERKPTPPAR